MEIRGRTACLQERESCIIPSISFFFTSALYSSILDKHAFTFHPEKVIKVSELALIMQRSGEMGSFLVRVSAVSCATVMRITTLE